MILGLALFAIALGTWLTRVLVRHRASRRAAAERDEYLPIVDPRAIWLWLNGPLTLVIGLGLLGGQALEAWREHQLVVADAEREAIAIGCRPGVVSVELSGTEPRELTFDAY